MEEQDRQGGIFEDLLCKTSKNKFVHPAVAICAHYHEIGLHRARGFENRVANITSPRTYVVRFGLDPVPAQPRYDAFKVSRLFVVLAGR